LSGLEIKPLLVTGYDSANETLVMRILEQLTTSVVKPLKLSGRQFMWRFSTVFLDLDELMKMPNNCRLWNVEFSGQSVSGGCRIGFDRFTQGFGIYSDRTTRAWFIFETGAPVIDSLEQVLRSAT
jgi:hypothetical protein